jgi:outer membrane protein assembly factor BamB
MGMRFVRTVGRRLPLVAALLAMVVSSGCWLQLGSSGGHTYDNPVETTLTPATVTGLHQVWSVTASGSASEPLVSQGRVFFSWTNAVATGVESLNLADGSTRWDKSLLGGVAGPNAVVLGTPVAFAGGQLLGGHLGYVPVTRVGPACILGPDVLDPATGAGGGGGSATGDFPSSAASANGIVARSLLQLGSGCSLPSSFTLDVSVSPPAGPAGQWRATIDDSFVGGTLLPAVTGNLVVLSHGVTVDGFAAAGCGAATCPPIWSTTFPDPVSPPMAGATGPVYVRTDASLLALDRTTGTELWRAPLATAGYDMALADGTVYVATVSPTDPPVLVALDAAGCGAATCTPRWTAALPGTGVSSLAVGGDVVYTSTDVGVQAFASAGCGATTCPPLTTVALPGPGQLAVAQGHVVLASGPTVTALGLG